PHPTAWLDLIQAWQATSRPEGARTGPWQGIVHLWSLDAPATETLSTTGLEEGLPLGCGSVLGLVQVLAQSEKGVAVSGKPRPSRPRGGCPLGTEPRSRLWLITRGAQAITADHAPASLAVAQAPL